MEYLEGDFGELLFTEFSWRSRLGSSPSLDWSYIYMNERLTPTNRKLLNEARQRTKAKNYIFKDYPLSGQVTVRKPTNFEQNIIENIEDLDKIVWNL